MVETLIEKAKPPVIDTTEKKKVPVMDDLKRTKNAFNKAIETLPKGRILDFLGMIQSFAENAKHEPIINLPENKNELEALGIELYPHFSKRTGEADGLKCLQKYWKHWLKHKDCTPSLNRDHMSQADLGRLDPQLLARLRTLYSADELNEIIPNETLLNIQIAKTISEDEKKEITKKHNIIYRHPKVA